MINLKKVCLKKVGLYAVAEYDKKNDVYTVYRNCDSFDEAEAYATELLHLAQKGELRRENGEPIDWIEIIHNDDHDVVYWVSYNKNTCGDRITL